MAGVDGLSDECVMPTYEYVCEKCGHQFEVFQSIVDPPLKLCPKGLCGQKKWGKGRVKRMIGSGAGVIFKGSGFYATDYRSESYKAAAKKESGATTAPAAAPSEAKPATPPSTAPAKSESKPGAAPPKAAAS